MTLKMFTKKASAIFTCSSMAIGGFAATGTNLINVTCAETNVDTSVESGTIKLSGQADNIKSFQVFNYNTTPIVYKNRTYRIGALIAVIPVQSDGTASISGLPYGSYRVKEYKTTTGYSMSKTYYTVKLTNETEEEILPSEPSVGVVGAIKLTGLDNISLNGMKFSLKNVGMSSVVYKGEVINVGESFEVIGTSDTITVADMPYGVFELKQTESVVGIHMDESTYTINIISDKTVPIEIKVSNHEHMWDEGVVTKAPTCTEDGVKTYTCSICGETKTEVLPKLGHDYQVTKEPTCLEPGYKTCSHCGDVIEIPQLEHDWDEGVVESSPTCEGNAVRVYTCKYCGEQKRVVLPRVLGHTYVSTLVKATPTSAGSIQKVCSKCGKVDTEILIASPEVVELAYDTTTFTNTAKRPSVKVKDTDGNTIASSQYTVTYVNNVKVGVATVRVQFKGNYSGVMTQQFEVLPKGTSLLSLTSLKNGFTVRWAKQSNETTGYELEYATEPDFSDAAILQTTNYTTLAKTVNWLPSKTKYYLRIRTYKGASYSQWSMVKTVTTK